MPLEMLISVLVDEVATEGHKGITHLLLSQF